MEKARITPSKFTGGGRQLSESGFTFIELMIALFISVCIIKVVLDVYTGTFNLVKSVNSYRQLRHRMMIIQHAIESEVSLAGYAGCFQIQPAIIVANNRISIMHMSFPSDRLVAQQGQTLSVTKQSYYHPGEKIMLSDCHQTNVFHISKSYRQKDSQRLLISEEIKNEYPAGASVARYFKTIIYRDQVRNNLLRIVNDARPVLIAEGVMDMQIRQFGNAVEFAFVLEEGGKAQTWYLFVPVRQR